jgi:undecaprenyl phosphate-alpha-L-ara4FN deformylase
MQVGLRIDVDTYRGTKLGAPRLCEILARHYIKATFFFSVGPDNMGRHLWRLMRPAFLMKMLRTNAASLYGWDILLRGTIVPGPIIGKKLAAVIRAVAEAGHEIGLHGWDHHEWQSKVENWSGIEVQETFKRGVELLTEILDRPPTCSASPAWRCTERVLEAKLAYPFTFNSDCRGDSIFQPVVAGRELNQPQIPTTLPTYDEVVGRNGISADNFNAFLLEKLRPDRLNVLTIHAEVEGIVCADMFDQFLTGAMGRGACFVPLGELLKGERAPLPRASIAPGVVAGREGWVSCQVANAT